MKVDGKRRAWHGERRRHDAHHDEKAPEAGTAALHHGRNVNAVGGGSTTGWTDCKRAPADRHARQGLA